MRFSTSRLKALGLAQRQIAELRARQRGGVAGSSGYEYQRRFALLRIFELAAGGANGAVSMEALCPVDDVVVEDKGHHEHSQIKESPTETWGKKKGKLAKEFRAQATLLRKAKAKTFSLQVVTPHRARVGHFRKTVPKHLKTVTTARHFPRARPAHQPWRVPAIAAQLDLLLVGEATSGASQRENLWRAVNHECGQPWRRAVRARDVVRSAGRSQRDLPLRDRQRRSVVPASRLAAALQALSSIPQLDIRIVDGVCFFVHANIERRFIAHIDDDGFARFVDRILQRLPTDITAFYGELP